MGKIKLRKQLKDILYEKYIQGHGMPKHVIKDRHNSTPYIHSQATYETYKKRVDAFCNWCQVEGIKTLQESHEHVKDYLSWLEHDEYAQISAWTIKTAGAALAKVFDCGINDFGYVYPKKERADIKRSRLITERDKHVSKAHNEELISFCKSTGLRRMEVENLRGRYTHKGVTHDTVFEQDGIWYIRVIGKGGKYRESEILGDKKQIQRVVSLIQTAGDSRVWAKVHDKLDVHGLRAEYACSIYRKYARSLEECRKEEHYHCRGDQKGQKYDKTAMQKASEALGHSRVSVVASNYFWKL